MTSRILVLLLLCVMVCASAWEKTWDYRKELPLNNGGTTMRVPPDVKTPEGGETLEVIQPFAREELLYPSHIQFPLHTSLLRSGGAVEVSFWLKGEPGTQIELRHTEMLPYSGHFSDTLAFSLDGSWQKISAKLTLRNLTWEPYAAVPRILLTRNFAGKPFYLGPLTVKNTVSVGEPAPVPVKIQADKEFRALPEGKLYVGPGTALDFSASVEQIPAGTRGRLIVNGKGELAFEQRPDDPVRFLCCSFAHHEELAFRTYSREELDEFADAILRQGYNMIRFHYLDEMLSGTKRGAFLKNPEPAVLVQSPGEIRFEPETLDRFFYFIHACGKRGIYLNLDLMSSFNGYDNGVTPHVFQNSDRTTKMQLFVNEAYRENWKAGAKRLLESVNPYNGKALKDDPAVAMVCGLNEQEILIPPRDYGKVFQPRWVAYLKRKYKSIEALRKAWNDPAPATFEAVPPVGGEIGKDTPMGRDMAVFCAGLEAEMSDFYLDAMREIGGEPLLGNWNMRPRFLEVPARAKLPVTMLNFYHAHPHYGKHTTVFHESAIRQGGNINKQFATMRFLDRPLISTEYGAVFWNRFRHEQGLLQGAGAALQQWSGMTVFSSPVIYGTRRIECFLAGADPVIRAAQAVEFFAFRRGDIAPARNTVEFPLDDELIFNGNAMRGIGDSLSRLWAVCRIGITYGKPRVPVNAALRIRPGKTAAVGGDGNYSTTSLDASCEDGEVVVKALRKRGLLPPENKTDPGNGIFQSDTGEVTMNAQSGELYVVSPRLEGAVLKSSKHTKLGAFTIQSCSVPASLTLISLDADAELSTAGRLLLVFAADALNSGMEFTSPERTMLIDYGKTPALLQTGRFSGSLKRKAAGGKFRLYALDLTGKRIAELPLTHAGNDVSFSVDTAAIPGAPAFFFELISLQNER